MHSIKYFCLLAIIITFSGSVSGQECVCALTAQSDDADSTEFWLKQLERSSQRSCKAKAWEWRGAHGSLDSANYYFEQALAIYDHLNCPDLVRLNLYKEWAGSWYHKGDFAKAQEYSLKLLSAAERADDAYEIGNANTMISQLFNQMAQADKGVIYARNAWKWVDKVSDAEKRMDLMYKISKRFLWHYQDFGALTSLDSSELLGKQILSDAKANRSQRWLSKSYNHLQGMAYERENYALAITYLDSSMIFIDHDQHADLAVNYYDLADLYLQSAQYDRALQYADSAAKYYDELNSLAYVASVYELKSRIHKTAGNHERALAEYEVYRNLSDSLNSAERLATLNELEKRYNQDKNEQTIRELSQQRVIYILLATSAIMIAVMIWIALRQKSLRQQQRILQTEQRLNRARMNPHFFFNALTALQRMALQEKDNLKVSTSLAQFGNVMRKSLESTYSDWVTVESEMIFLQEYLTVQQVRFENGFQFKVESESAVEINEVMIPSMLVQPLVENSLEHGFSGIAYQGEISVRFSKTESQLIITVTDNGKGVTDTISKDYTSRATGILNDRLFLLNQTTGQQAGFSLQPGPHQGTCATLKLPLVYQANSLNHL